MKILMVCLGNICRSPMAEGILKWKLTEAGITGWTVESAGTNRWHKGGPADPRSVAACLRRGVDIQAHIARRVTPEDFKRYDILYSMASDVTEELRQFMNEPRIDSQRVKLFLDELDSAAAGRSVPDPWYDDESGFDECFSLIEKTCERLVERARSLKV